MKNVGFIVFIVLIWGVGEAFADPVRLIPVAVYFASLLCMTLIPKRTAGRLIAAALCAGLAFYDPGFTLRTVPTLLLIGARESASRLIGARRPGKNAGGDGVITAALYAALISVGTLIYDIVYGIRNPSAGNGIPSLWFPLFVLPCFLVLTVFAAKQKPFARRILLSLYVAAVVGAVSAAAGYYLNAFVCSGFTAACPWWIMAVCGAHADPAVLAARDATVLSLKKCLVVEEKNV